MVIKIVAFRKRCCGRCPAKTLSLTHVNGLSPSTFEAWRKVAQSSTPLISNKYTKSGDVNRSSKLFKLNAIAKRFSRYLLEFTDIFGIERQVATTRQRRSMLNWENWKFEEPSCEVEAEHNRALGWVRVRGCSHKVGGQESVVVDDMCRKHIACLVVRVTQWSWNRS